MQEQAQQTLLPGLKLSYDHPHFDGGFIFYSALSANWAFLPLLPQHLSCGEDGVANALRAGTEDLAGLHAL